MALVPRTFTHEDLNFSFMEFIHPETNEVWVTAKDFARCLGYKVPSKAVYDHVKNLHFKRKWCDLIKNLKIDIAIPKNWKYNTMMLNKQGTSTLMVSSRLPVCKAYKDWLCASFLPQHIPEPMDYFTTERNVGSVSKHQNDSNHGFVIIVTTEQLKVRGQCKICCIRANVDNYDSTVPVRSYLKSLNAINPTNPETEVTMLFGWKSQTGYVELKRKIEHLMTINELCFRKDTAHYTIPNAELFQSIDLFYDTIEV